MQMRVSCSAGYNDLKGEICISGRRRSLLHRIAEVLGLDLHAWFPVAMTVHGTGFTWVTIWAVEKSIYGDSGDEIRTRAQKDDGRITAKPFKIDAKSSAWLGSV